MQYYLKRLLADKVKTRLREIESVAIIGPRQVGKSTMAKSILNDLQIDECFVIAPIKDDFENKNIRFVSINSFINKFRDKGGTRVS